MISAYLSLTFKSLDRLRSVHNLYETFWMYSSTMGLGDFSSIRFCTDNWNEFAMNIADVADVNVVK